MNSTPYGWRNCTNPFEEKDAPTLEDVADMRAWWQSACCKSPVLVTQAGAKHCSCCGRFCAVDPVATVDRYDREEGPC